MEERGQGSGSRVKGRRMGFEKLAAGFGISEEGEGPGGHFNSFWHVGMCYKGL